MRRQLRVQLDWVRQTVRAVLAGLRRLIQATWQWVSNHQRLTTLIGAASLTVAALALVNDVRSSSPPPDKIPSGVATGGPTETPKTWAAKIVNTFSEEQGRFRGVVAARSPYVSGRADRGYQEGTVIYVICQVHDGRLVTDEVSGQQLSSTIWNKTTDDVWVPDIYSDLPKGTGDLPPRC